jgi:hypothetical protein
MRGALGSNPFLLLRRCGEARSLHPGESLSILVIPAAAFHFSSSRRKPGSSAFACLRSGAPRDNRLTSLCFFARHPWRAGHFSLLAHCAAEAALTAKLAPKGRRAGCPESREVTKRKGIPGVAPAAALWVRYGRPGFARVLRATLRAFSAALRRPTRGPRSRAPSSAFGTCTRAIHGACPAGGCAVQNGNPAVLSPARGRRKNSPSPACGRGPG